METLTKVATSSITSTKLAIATLAALAAGGAAFASMPTGSRCLDTDGGIMPKVNGTVTYRSISNTDKCLDSSRLTEYYCYSKDTAPKSVVIYASSTYTYCQDGAMFDY